MDIEVPFQGREEFLKDFIIAWNAKKYLVYGIYGMRSVGKSRTVKKHIDDVQKIIQQEHKQLNVKIIDVNMRFLKTDKQLHEQMCAFFGILPDPSYDGQPNAWFQQIELHIKSADQFFILVFDNCEDVMDSELKDTFLSFVVTLAKIKLNIRVYITSTTQILFTQIKPAYFYKTLEPMNDIESKKLLRAAAKNVNFGEHLDKIVELCGGLPLALLMTGSELEADEGMLKPEDMVELLSECRLRALSREFYPKDDRIADVYKDFILRLSEVFQQRLACLGYIPGSFTASQVKEMLGQKTVALTKDLVLIPMKRRNFISFNSKTERFDIHGILRDCLSVYVCIKNIPAVRKRYCKTFTEEIKKISRLMSTTDYAEALELFGQENPNLQKLLTEVLYTSHDTYHFFIEVASTCSTLLENFMASHCEKFYEGCLKITSDHGRHQDEAVVKISFGSMLTNAKGDTIGGEKYYRQALQVLKAGPPCVKLAEVHQRLGWNLHVQGRAEESLRHLKSSFEMSQSLGNKKTVLCLQSLNSLGVVCTFLGNFDDAEKYYTESIRQNRKNLEEENLERVKQKKKPLSEDELPKFGAIFNNMGIMYQQRGENDKALYYHKKGLDIKRAVKAPTTALLVSINNVAADYSLLGRHDEAIELLKEGESIVLKEVPPNESNLSTIYDTMGKVYLKCNKFLKAREYLVMAVKSRETYMATSPMHAESIMHLSQAEMGLKNYKIARNLAEKVVSMKDVVTKSMPQNSFISEAMECLVEICLQSNNENIGRLQEIYLELEEELKRLIRLHENKYNDKLVQHFKKRLMSIEKKVREAVCKLDLTD
ncbi:hypothetical protein ACJMK2_028577 [Sinanodonta woodiana]|uniref:Uncharacterized protein n=1 Tax=Sinanodonta woodiana TaxID=1069815 RepID=A0ABD3X7J9_SINWO